MAIETIYTIGYDSGYKVTHLVDQELDYADRSVRESIDFADEYMHNV